MGIVWDTYHFQGSHFLGGPWFHPTDSGFFPTKISAAAGGFGAPQVNQPTLHMGWEDVGYISWICLEKRCLEKVPQKNPQKWCFTTVES